MFTTIRTGSAALCMIVAAAALQPGVSHADDGFMIGAGAYYAQVNDDFRWDDVEDIFDIDFDDSSFSYNLQAGYRFNNWLSIDAAYWDLGSYKSDVFGDGNKAKFDGEAWTIGGMLSVPLWIVDVYAKAGAAYWELDGRRVDEDGTDPYYGVGAALNVFRSLDLYVEWVRFDLETELDTLGLGVRWTF